MRLAFIHGINNEHETAETIERAWWEAILRGWTAADLAHKPKPPISVAYYADILAGTTVSAAAEMGTPSAASTGLAVDLLREYKDAAGITDAEIDAAAAEAGLPPEAIEQGVPHEGWIVGVASVLERILPTKGKLIARLYLRQAVTYINDKALAAQIDRKVASAIFDGKRDPVIVIAHSLGTVVSYRVLANERFDKRDVPLFVTLGSPLSVRMFRSILPARGAMPKPPIGRWFNARHKDDFVTLGRGIVTQSIGFDGIVDSTEIDGDDPDRHAIAQYLSSRAIARAIHELL
jgi:hypothetical protein